mmetsp:Transcript_29455/g.94583  ORF Transcript_29455/g.94583 Transcript_29455/m.94583 type:complete len:570 (-) Transcript_29455:1638-3347(-)|eukprot:CAMPEP_0118885764 /NCGR_PEP_ID=MMETSP1163-20130328/24105_1 /TAXON_ID=124430 /ORGANISM="Phaeomonas parva, Strain CCMP2877" /LENGTH=569 /DNA_ID=CAMNT_0006823831 /DNA_START=167 /DNA_END=1876 /DNA_ORIENTATION=-
MAAPSVEMTMNKVSEAGVKSEGAVLRDDQDLRRVDRTLSALCFIVTALDADDHDDHDDNDDGAAAASRRRSAQFLLSLFTLDSCLWAVGRMVVYECVVLAGALGHSQVLVSLVMSTAEVFAEFAASAIVPAAFRFLNNLKGEGGVRLRARGLGVFALQMYCASGLAGVVVYAPLAFFMEGLGWKSLPMLVLLVAVQNAQYSFLNQMGDQALEMSRTHWLKTFDGLELIFPACCCAARRPAADADPWLGYRRPATANTLSVSLSLARVLLATIFAIAYVGARDATVVRWAGIIGISLGVSLVAGYLIRQRGAISEGITNEEVPDDQDFEVVPLWRMERLDVEVVIFAVIFFSLPYQAFQAIVALLVLRLSAVAYAVMVIAGVVGVVAYLVNSAKHADDAVSEEGRTPPCLKPLAPTTEFATWQRFIWTMAVSLSVSSVMLLLVVQTSILYVVVIALLPFAIADQGLYARFVSFLFEFPEERSTLVQYWINTVYVSISAPLLTVNWALTLLSRSEYEQAGWLSALCAVAFLAATAYLQFVESGSLAASVNGVGAKRTERGGVGAERTAERP